MDINSLLLLLFAYLSGSICSAIIVSKAFSLPDPRKAGSRNPGTTNVLRIAGFWPALLTFIGDIIKTALPIFLALKIGHNIEQSAWLGVAAVFGHCFPAFFLLKGGKGVASLMTLFIITLPQLALLTLGVWIIAAWGFRRSSIASILMALIVPFFTYYFYPNFILAFTTASAIILIQHRRNIAKIIKGVEPLIGERWNENK